MKKARAQHSERVETWRKNSSYLEKPRTRKHVVGYITCVYIYIYTYDIIYICIHRVDIYLILTHDIPILSPCCSRNYGPCGPQAASFGGLQMRTDNIRCSVMERCLGILSHINHSMDWIKGKFTGNHRFSH